MVITKLDLPAEDQADAPRLDQMEPTVLEGVISQEEQRKQAKPKTYRCTRVNIMVVTIGTLLTVAAAMWVGVEGMLDAVVPIPTAEDVERGPRPLTEHASDGVASMQYIVGLDEGANGTQMSELLDYLMKHGSTHTPLPVLDAVDAELTPALLAELQSGAWPIVVSIEKNAQIFDPNKMNMDGTSMPGSRPSARQLRGLTRADAHRRKLAGEMVESYRDNSSMSDSIPWHLDFLDSQPTDGNFSTNLTGEGVDIYIVDTGVRRTHQEFKGRIDSRLYGDRFDQRGHGTAMAGAAAGSAYGAAKRARLISVQVLGEDGLGTIIDFVKGLSWIASTASPLQKSVVSMSLTGPRSFAIDNAVQNLIDMKLPTIVSAGNAAHDACEFSPAAVPEALTVGSVGQSGELSFFSNYGDCVDLYAPGESIVTASSDEDTLSVSVQGTSPACAIASGVASLFLQAGDGHESLHSSMTQAARTVGSMKLLQVPDADPAFPSPGDSTAGPAQPSAPTQVPDVSVAEKWTHAKGTVKAPVKTMRSFVSPKLSLQAGGGVIAALDCQCTSERCNIDLYIFERIGWQWTPVALSRSRTSREHIQMRFRRSASVVAMAYARRGSANCEIQTREI